MDFHPPYFPDEPHKATRVLESVRTCDKLVEDIRVKFFGHAHLKFLFEMGLAKAEEGESGYRWFSWLENRLVLHVNMFNMANG